jgi:hypothetical protein
MPSEQQASGIGLLRSSVFRRRSPIIISIIVVVNNDLGGAGRGIEGAFDHLLLLGAGGVVGVDQGGLDVAADDRPQNIGWKPLTQDPLADRSGVLSWRAELPLKRHPMTLGSRECGC